MKYEIFSYDEKTVLFRLTSDRKGRAVSEFSVPIGAELRSRDHRAKRLSGATDTGHAILDGRCVKPSSVMAHYDMSPYQVTGLVRPSVPTPQVELFERPSTSIVRADIAGLPLEVVEDEWVTLRSVFGPFGKEVGEQLPRLQEWAGEKLRKFPLPSQTVEGNQAKRASSLQTWCIRWRAVPMAIAELPIRGMSEEIRAGLVRFKRECEDALAAYFFDGRAENPRAIIKAPIEPASNLLLAELVAMRRDQQEFNSRLLERLLPPAPALQPGSVVVPPAEEGYEYSQGRLARRLGLPETGDGSNLVGTWARELRMHGQPPWSSWVSVGIVGHLVEDAHVRYSNDALERLKPLAEAAIEAMRGCGYRIVGGKLSAAGSRPTSKSLCATRMRDAGLAVSRAA